MDGRASLLLNMTAVFLAVIAAMAVKGVMGWGIERVIVKPVYGAHLKQILVTVGGLIVVEQLIHVIWGLDEIFINRPETLKGAITFAGAAMKSIACSSLWSAGALCRDAHGAAPHQDWPDCARRGGKWPDG